MFRSSNSNVNPPASTGSLATSRNLVTTTDHTNNGSTCRLYPVAFMYNAVDMKLILLNKLLIPAMCNANTSTSTLNLLCAILELRGGYSTQDTLLPDSI